MNRFFIDWFAVSQVHQHKLNYVGEQMVTRTDLSTGEVMSNSPNSKKLMVLILRHLLFVVMAIKFLYRVIRQDSIV